jgi:hypothetical protein
MSPDLNTNLIDVSSRMWSSSVGCACSSALKLIGRCLARSAICRELEANLLPFDKTSHASPLDCADMDENVRTTVHALEKAIALLGIEPLNCAYAHNELL